jgi:ATP-dependent exoDNAse (exonuclease V) beta subunit
MDYPLTRKLIALRKNRKYLSVFEILDQIISSLDIKRLIVEWGNPDQRLDNIDQIRSIALKYEESCKSLHIATSLSGFIFWCQRKIETKADFQGAGEGPDAVRVLTYHRSKGLEWPIVILMDLDKDVNTKINNLTIVPKNNTIDLSNILGNRWVRLWINPYGKNNKKTVLWDNIEKSPEWEYQNKQDLAEEIRLFYVGFTRARDYLILPQADKNLSVINRIWNKDLEELNLLDLNNESISIPWNDENLTFQRFPMRFIDQTPEMVREYTSFLYTEAAKGEVDHITKLIQYEDLSGIKEVTTTFKIIETVTIWEDLNTENWSHKEKELLKMAMAAFINEWHPDEESYRIKILAEDLLKEFSLTDLLPTTFFIEVSDRLTSLVEPLFFDFIDKNHLVTSYVAQREYNFYIPMVIESEQENIFVTLITNLDNKSVEQLLDDHKNKLAFENELIKRNKASENIQNWVLLVSKGIIVKIDWILNDSLEEIINNL